MNRSQYAQGEKKVGLKWYESPWCSYCIDENGLRQGTATIYGGRSFFYANDLQDPEPRQQTGPQEYTLIGTIEFKDDVPIDCSFGHIETKEGQEGLYRLAIGSGIMVGNAFGPKQQPDIFTEDRWPVEKPEMVLIGLIGLGYLYIRAKK